MKKFRKANQTRPLSFAFEEDLMVRLGLTAGAVTPLGILNDEEKKVLLFLDQDFFEEPGLIGVHPNDNTATVWLKTEDLVIMVMAAFVIGCFKKDLKRPYFFFYFFGKYLTFPCMGSTINHTNHTFQTKRRVK